MCAEHSPSSFRYASVLFANRLRFRYKAFCAECLKHACATGRAGFDFESVYFSFGICINALAVRVGSSKDSALVLQFPYKFLLY